MKKHPPRSTGMWCTIYIYIYILYVYIDIWDIYILVYGMYMYIYTAYMCICCRYKYIYIYVWYIYISMLYGIYLYIYICICPKKLPVPLQLKVFSPLAGFPIGNYAASFSMGVFFSYSKDVHSLKLTSKAPENGWKRKTILLPFCDVAYFQGRKR